MFQNHFVDLVFIYILGQPTVLFSENLFAGLKLPQEFALNCAQKLTTVFFGVLSSNTLVIRENKFVLLFEGTKMSLRERTKSGEEFLESQPQHVN